jgi:hypothetical protein
MGSPASSAAASAVHRAVGLVGSAAASAAPRPTAGPGCKGECKPLSDGSQRCTGLARIPALHRCSRIERMRRLPSIQSPIPTATHPLNLDWSGGFVQHGLPAAGGAQLRGKGRAAADKR